MDYWFDHPQERWETGFRYAESMKKYEIAGCARALIDMFRKAIEAKKNEMSVNHYIVLSGNQSQTIREHRHSA
jgi:hypothetical protein